MASFTSFPLDANSARMLEMSQRLECSEEIVTIVALMSVGDIFNRPRNAEAEADFAKEKFPKENGDLVRMLNVYEAWLTNDKSPTWCNENFIHYENLQEASRIRERLCDLMKAHNMSIQSAGSSNMRAVLKCICYGLIQNVAQNIVVFGPVSYKYLTLPKRKGVFVFPGSTQFHKTPEWVVYKKIVETKKAYLHGVTPVEAEWIKEFAPSVYDQRRPHPCEELSKCEQLIAEAEKRLSIRIVKN